VAFRKRFQAIPPFREVHFPNAVAIPPIKVRLDGTLTY
jgi:hypothetical protein